MGKLAGLLPHASAKRIVLGILQENGGTFHGQTRLYKAFYDAHLFYWRQHGKYLTDHAIVCMPNGPGIDDGREIIEQLVSGGFVRRTEQPVGPYAEDVYTLCSDAQLELNDEEKEAIVNAIQWVGDKTGTQISHESHERSVTWREARANDRLGAELHITWTRLQKGYPEALRFSS